jgi:glutaredoxin
MGASSSNANKEQIKTWVNEEISSNLVVIFSKTYCPYCSKAKNAFQAAGLHKYTVYELDKRDDGDTILDVLRDMTGARTVRISLYLPSFASEVHALACCFEKVLRCTINVAILFLCSLSIDSYKMKACWVW